MPKKLNEIRQKKSMEVVYKAISNGKHSEWVTDGWINPRDLDYVKEYLTAQGFFVEYRTEYPYPKLYWSDFSLRASEFVINQTSKKESFWSKIKNFFGMSILLISFGSCTNTECLKSHTEQYDVLEYDYISSEVFKWVKYDVEVCDEYIITNLPVEKNKNNMIKIYHYK